MILLDTHAWLWLAAGEELLSSQAQTQIGAAIRNNALYVSPISMWEISLKYSRGKLDLGMPLRAWMARSLDFPGLSLAPITAAVACDCAELPPEFHGDPADRIIAATARNEGLTLVTHDRSLLQLAKRGYFRALAT